jgi:hypothetical protein
MPRVRRGPNGPRRSTAGVKGTNKRTPSGGAKGSGNSHTAQLTPRTRGRYSKKKGY